MFFWNKICAITGFFILLSAACCGQHLPDRSIHFNNKNLHSTPANRNEVQVISFERYSDFEQKFGSEKQILRILPQDFYTNNFGFFCKQELRLEKTIKLPVRFRLGSLQQCNYYEGKN